MAAHLSSNFFKMNLIENKARESFMSFIDELEGTKAVIWDREVTAPMTNLTTIQQLGRKGLVTNLCLMSELIPNLDVKSLLFVVRPGAEQMDLVAQYVHAITKADRLRNVRKEVRILFVPKVTRMCMLRLMDRGVIDSEELRKMNGDLNPNEKIVFSTMELHSLNCHLFPLDSDLMSMEITSSFREVVVEKDPTYLMDVAHALHGIELEIGPIPRIVGLGHAAQTVVDYFSQIKREDRGKSQLMPSSIRDVVLIDRSTDLITPLVTQLTYEGLIDEMFGINSTILTLPAHRFSHEEEPVNATSSTKTIILNSSDKLYAEIRNCNFNGVGPILKKTAQSVQAQLDQRHNTSLEKMRTFVSQLPQLQASKAALAVRKYEVAESLLNSGPVQAQSDQRHNTSLEKMRTFVSQLPQLQASKAALAIHTTVAELIKEKTDNESFLGELRTEQELLCGIDTERQLPFIEDSIAKKKPLLKVLRLLCLQSLVNGGLRPKTLEFYKRELVQTYGLQILQPLGNLEKAGLLHASSSSQRNIAGHRKHLLLINENENEIDPVDIYFTHSIYAPISVRLIQNYTKWKTSKEIKDLVPVPYVERSFDHANSWKQTERSTVLVFFLGGCTYAEVAALRFLSSKDSSIRYVVGTTKLINGDSLLKSVMSTDSAAYSKLFN